MTPALEIAIHVLLVVAAIVHFAGIIILGFWAREAIRLSKAVGALVIQEEAKTREFFLR